MNAPRLMVQFRKFGLGLILVWSCILAAILLFIIDDYREDTIKEATMEARVYNSLNLQYRRWGAMIGSEYAPTDKVASNPHLAVPERDLKTESGQSLSPINPAYMTRMVFEAVLKGSENPIINRLVSLNPQNPANRPNAWELETLRLFEKREASERSRLLTIDKRSYLQFMTAFITEASCLKCHAHQGYKVGDVRGGISSAKPMSGNLAVEAKKINSLVGGFALLWFLGTAGIAVSSNRRHQQERKLVEDRSILEEEVTKRQIVQEQLEKQAGRWEEEAAKRLLAVVALQKSEHFLNTIIDTEPECIKLLDADCNLLMMNRAGLEMIDAESFEQVKGHCLCPLVSEPYRSAFVELTNRVFQGIPGSLEFEVIGLKGRSLWLHTMAVPFRDENGTIVAALTITRNVTERKQAEEELHKKNAEIEQFIYTVSHDLRSPLVTVKTFLGFLEGDMKLTGDNQERVSQDLQFIHSAADKMKMLLDELLEISRIDHVETLPVRVSLLEVVAEVLEVLGGGIIERKVDIRLPETELVLFGDRSRLSRIWQNLIENAIKYSRNDGIPRIELGVQQVNGETVFFVKDNGIGIEPQYHSKIFGIFEKLDQKSPGAGMGLSMIQRIVEKFGGRVWAESEGTDKGSCFYFTLPHALVQS